MGLSGPVLVMHCEEAKAVPHATKPGVPVADSTIDKLHIAMSKVIIRAYKRSPEAFSVFIALKIH